MSINKAGRLVFLSALVSMIGARPVVAQAGTPRDTTGFTFTLVANSQPGTHAPITIIRRASVSPHDIILIDRQTVTIKDLMSALAVMEHIKDKFGDGAQTDMRAVVTKQNDRSPERGEQIRLSMYLQHLDESQIAYVQGVGRVHALTIHAPRFRFAGRLETPAR